MANSSFIPVNGVIVGVRAGDDCCSLIVTLRTQDGINNFIVSSETYVINEVRLRIGMSVTAFYDGNLPVPLIYPPQYRATIIGRRNPNETIIANTFGPDLVATDQSLKLNIGPSTEIVTSNGQVFRCPLENRLLIVYYTSTTRSIPPQTTPRKIIVMC